MNKNIIYMGTTEFSAYILKQLIKNNYNIIALVSQPDRKVGRKQQVKATPTKLVALEYDIPVLSYENINEHVNELKDFNSDLFITCAYGQKLTQAILDIPRLKAINVHASRLPKYRGGAPIHYAIMEGEEYSGNTIMYMEQGLDTGAMLNMSQVKIEQDDTTTMLSNNLMIDAAELLLKTLDNIFDNKIKPIEQDHTKATQAYNISSKQEYITFNREVDVVYNHIRGLLDIPGCYAYLNDKKIKFTKARKLNQDHNYEIGSVLVDSKEYFKIACLNGFICIYEFKIEGKKVVSFKDYLNGNKLEIQTGLIINKGVQNEN